MAENFDIAKKSLEQNIIKLSAGHFVSAGANQFRSFWTRDFCLSAKGLVAIGRTDVLKEHVEYLIKNRRADQLVPLYVDSMNPVYRVMAAVGLGLFGLPTALPVRDKIAPYFLVNGKYEVADSNVLVLYAAWVYYRSTKDKNWYDSHQADFRQIFDFYKSKISNGLIEQGEHADWQDSAQRKGFTFFTNLLYYHMGLEFGFLTAQEAEKLKSKIIEVFYMPDTGLFRSMAGRDNTSLEGILWAIENQLLLNHNELYLSLKKHPLFQAFGIPGYATYPSYTSDDMYIQVKIVGIQEYHGKFFWSWLMGFAGKVAYLQKDTESFQKIHCAISSMLKRDRVVCEVYEPSEDHKPVRTWIYKSERPFSWGAGYILDMEKTVNSGC